MLPQAGKKPSAIGQLPPFTMDEFAYVISVTGMLMGRDTVANLAVLLNKRAHRHCRRGSRCDTGVATVQVQGRAHTGAGTIDHQYAQNCGTPSRWSDRECWDPEQAGVWSFESTRGLPAVGSQFCRVECLGRSRFCVPIRAQALAGRAGLRVHWNSVPKCCRFSRRLWQCP